MELLKCDRDWLNTDLWVLLPQSACLWPDSRDTMLLITELCCWMLSMPWWFFIGLCLLVGPISSIEDSMFAHFLLRLDIWFVKAMEDLWFPKWYWCEEPLDCLVELGGLLLLFQAFPELKFKSGFSSLSSGMLILIFSKPNLGEPISFYETVLALPPFSLVFKMLMLLIGPTAYLEISFCFDSCSIELIPLAIGSNACESITLFRNLGVKAELP